MIERLKTGWTVYLCFALVHFTVWTLPVRAANSAVSEDDQIERIQSRLSEETRNLSTFKSKEAHLLTLVAALESQISNIKREIALLTSNVREVGVRLDDQKEKLKEHKSILIRMELQISDYLIALYKYSRRGNFRILANAETIGDLQRRIKYIGIVTEEDRHNLHELADQVSDRQNEIIEAEASIAEMERLLKEDTSRLVFLETSLEEKVLSLVKIHEEKEFYETSVEELETAVADLKQALGPVDPKDLYAIDPSLGFEDCKGRLPLPIPGRIVNGSDKIGVAFANAKGVVIQADAASPVRAVFRGKVAYSGHLKGYGEVVIVNHGGRFFTVSAHLSKRKKAKGDQVQGGDIVGWVEENGTANGASLYFEIRKADSKLNPRAWLKAD